MSDVEQMLDRAARSVETAPASDVVEADVDRGRSAMLRRRRRRTIRTSIASTAAATALVGAAIVVGNPGDSPAARPEPAPSHRQDAGVRLVAYTGDQPPGFIVDRVPEGWYIQPTEHPQYTVTIAPEGDTSHPDDFVGKLVVMLQSRSVSSGLPDGDPVEVNGRPGTVTHEAGAADLLTYTDGDGHYVEVQAWTAALHWSNEQLVSFAEGVTVTPDAVAGVG